MSARRISAAYLVALALVVFHGALAAQTEKIAEIRVHGNHTTPDADILALSGLTAGEDAAPNRISEAERKLRGAGRFEDVEVRRRYLSISDPSQILIMIVVDEHPAVSATDLTPGPLKKLGSATMWLPILQHKDGYGFTYGARVAFPDVLGDRSRVSVPMTWGGERRIALEAERLFDGPVSVVKGGVSFFRRVNPHFEQPDTRREGRVEVERTVTDWLRVGANARVAAVEFGDAYEARHTAGGLHTVFDTRIDPSFPRNAIHARLGWERLAFSPSRAVGSAAIGAGDANRWLTDVRGYVGIGGSTVLALRGQLARSNSALPLAEQTLLGGSDSLRGYRTGYRAGDNMAAGTIEVRQPLNSPLNAGRFGLKVFVDAGTTWAAGGRMGDQPFDRGIGGGIYFGVGPFMMDLDVAKPEEGRPRAHFGMGVNF